MFHCSRCNTYSVWMADVIAIVADGIATNYYKWYDSMAAGMATSMLADLVTNYMMADVIATCGRWNGHMCFDKADVIAIVADGIATWLECVRQILLPWWQMEQATGSVYFNFSSLLLIRTSSHIWHIRHHQNWVSCKGKHFSIHQMKPDQLDSQKLVFFPKLYLVIEK